MEAARASLPPPALKLLLALVLLLLLAAGSLPQRASAGESVRASTSRFCFTEINLGSDGSVSPSSHVWRRRSAIRLQSLHWGTSPACVFLLQWDMITYGNALFNLFFFFCFLFVSVQTSPWACSVQWRRPPLGEQDNGFQNGGRRKLLSSIRALQHVGRSRVQLLL